MTNRAAAFQRQTITPQSRADAEGIATAVTQSFVPLPVDPDKAMGAEYAPRSAEAAFEMMSGAMAALQTDQEFDRDAQRGLANTLDEIHTQHHALMGQVHTRADARDLPAGANRSQLESLATAQTMVSLAGVAHEMRRAAVENGYTVATAGSIEDLWKSMANAAGYAQLSALRSVDGVERATGWPQEEIRDRMRLFGHPLGETEFYAGERALMADRAAHIDPLAALVEAGGRSDDTGRDNGIPPTMRLADLPRGAQYIVTDFQKSGPASGDDANAAYAARRHIFEDHTPADIRAAALYAQVKSFEAQGQRGLADTFKSLGENVTWRDLEDGASRVERGATGQGGPMLDLVRAAAVEADRLQSEQQVEANRADLVAQGPDAVLKTAAAAQRKAFQEADRYGDLSADGRVGLNAAQEIHIEAARHDRDLSADDLMAAHAAMTKDMPMTNEPWRVRLEATGRAMNDTAHAPGRGQLDEEVAKLAQLDADALRAEAQTAQREVLSAALSNPHASGATRGKLLAVKRLHAHAEGEGRGLTADELRGAHESLSNTLPLNDNPDRVRMEAAGRALELQARNRGLAARARAGDAR